MTNIYYDPIRYNIYLLSLYINQLAQYNINNQKINKLTIENNELNNDIITKDTEIVSLKRKLTDFETSKNKLIKINKYKPIIYKINKKSWSDDKINDTLLSIKSIDDIILLLNDDDFNYFNHNINLQKLFNIKPALLNLKNLVGISDIKNDLFKKIIYYINNDFQNEYLHTIISGPPGVGKTEFAKIYADIFVRLGILKSDKFIEIKRDDLVGEYLGSTSIKTKKKLEEGLGGVIFLDEAYALGNKEKRDSFSKEAIDMINIYLSEKKSEFMFIIAGYEEDIENCFFSYNKGLKRRFHSHYKIDGYKPCELKEIFIRKIKETSLILNIDSNKLNTFFNEYKNKFEFFGGDIEKLINEIKYIQSIRNFNFNLKSNEIIFEDIELAITNIFNKKEKSDFNFFMYS